MVSVDLTNAVAEAIAYPLGLKGNDFNALAIKSAVADATAAGIKVKLEREPEWASEVTGWSWVSQISSGNRFKTHRGSNMNRILVMEGETVTVRGRPTDPEGATLYLADVDTALVQVFDTTAANRSTPVYSENLVLSQVLYATKQIDAGWRTDKHGYTYKYRLPANVLKEGGRVYRIETILRTKTKGPTSIVNEAETSSLWSSRSLLGV